MPLVQAYLRRLGIDHHGRPTADGLRRLHRAHVERIPYEAIEIQLGRPTTVDPQAYVAHVGQVDADIAVNASWRDAVGRGSGEAIQLKLTGSGTVYVQASEQKV